MWHGASTEEECLQTSRCKQNLRTGNDQQLEQTPRKAASGSPSVDAATVGAATLGHNTTVWTMELGEQEDSLGTASPKLGTHETVVLNQKSSRQHAPL